MCAASVGPSSLNSLQILIPFINLYWVLATCGWQQCRNPNFSPLYFSLICNTTSNHTLCKRNFLIPILGRWFQRFRWFQKFRIFERGFCPFCVRFLPSAPTNEWTHVVQKRALALCRQCSDLDSGIPNLVFKLQVPLFRQNLLQNPTYCEIQVVTKSNLLHITRGDTFIVKGTNQILRCITHRARRRRA